MESQFHQQEENRLSKYNDDQIVNFLLVQDRWDRFQEGLKHGLDPSKFPAIEPDQNVDESDSYNEESYRHYGENVQDTEILPIAKDVLHYLTSCPDEDWDEFYKRIAEDEKVIKARTDINAFMEYCFQDKDGVSYHQQNFQRDWQALIPTAAEAKLIAQGANIEVMFSDGEVVVKSLLTQIGAPREHAKSSQVSVGRVIFELGRNHNIRVKVVTAKDKLAKDIIFDISQNIEKNIRIRRVFPDLLPDYKNGWTKTQLFIERDTSAGKDASVEATSVLASGAGGRCDLLIFDDVVDFRNAISSPALREQVNRAITEVWIPLMPPDGRCVYCATPWHSQDFTMLTKKNPEWAHWWKPAFIEGRDVNGNLIKFPLWPEKWTPVALEKRKAAIGIRAFTRQFLLIALSDDESTFPERFLQNCFDKEYSEIGEGVDPKWPRYAGVDLASSLNKKAAWTVIFTIAINPENNRRYPVEIYRQKIKFPDLIRELVSQWLRHKWELVLVENNGFQDAVEAQLKEENASIPVQGFRTGSNKADEELGLPGLATVFSNGAWVIPYGNRDEHALDCQCELCAWISELRGHPLTQYSDTVMANWFAERAAVKGGSQFEESFNITGRTLAESLLQKDPEQLRRSLERLNIANSKDPGILISSEVMERMMWKEMYESNDD